MEIGIKEAKNRLSILVREVQSGKRIFLTNRGLKVAELIPVTHDLAQTKPLRGLGMFKGILLPAGFGSREQRRKATAAVLKDMRLEK